MNLGPLILWIPLGVLAVVFGLFVIWILLGFLGIGIASAARSRRHGDDLSVPLRAGSPPLLSRR